MKEIVKIDASIFHEIKKIAGREVEKELMNIILRQVQYHISTLINEKKNFSIYLDILEKSDSER